MATPVPNITGGAATSGDVRSSLGVNFAPISVGGLFGSGAQSSQNNLLIPALIVGGALLAFLFFRKK